MPNKGKESQDKRSAQERRKYKRINKHFILTYFHKNNPSQKIEITQLKNISMGGMCFVTSQKFDSGTQLGVELKTPYLADTTYLEGVVLESHEKVMDLIYETRLKFELLNPQAEFLLAKLIEFFINEEKTSHD